MGANESQKQDIISTIKEWASPILIGIVGMLVWSDITDLKTDVKTILAQQSIDRTEVQGVKSDVALLKQVWFSNLSNTQTNNKQQVER